MKKLVAVRPVARLRPQGWLVQGRAARQAGNDAARPHDGGSKPPVDEPGASVAGLNLFLPPNQLAVSRPWHEPILAHGAGRCLVAMRTPDCGVFLDVRNRAAPDTLHD